MASGNRTDFFFYLHSSVPTRRQALCSQSKRALACMLNMKHTPSVSLVTRCFKEKHRVYVLMKSRVLSRWQSYVLSAVSKMWQIHGGECESRIQTYENIWTYRRLKLGTVHINRGRTWLRISTLDADIIYPGCGGKAICRRTRRFWESLNTTQRGRVVATDFRTHSSYAPICICQTSLGLSSSEASSAKQAFLQEKAYPSC